MGQGWPPFGQTEGRSSGRMGFTQRLQESRSRGLRTNTPFKGTCHWRHDHQKEQVPSGKPNPSAWCSRETRA